MTRTVIVRSTAEADIAAAALWYEGQSQGLSAQFLDSIQDAIHRANLLPRAHLLLRRKPEIRRVLTSGFPYRIYFHRRARPAGRYSCAARRPATGAVEWYSFGAGYKPQRSPACGRVRYSKHAHRFTESRPLM